MKSYRLVSVLHCLACDVEYCPFLSTIEIVGVVASLEPQKPFPSSQCQNCGQEHVQVVAGSFEVVVS